MVIVLKRTANSVSNKIKHLTTYFGSQQNDLAPRNGVVRLSKFQMKWFGHIYTRFFNNTQSCKQVIFSLEFVNILL